MTARLLECRVMDTGGCFTREGILLRGGSMRRRVRCPALVALLRHPREGWVLWDTGYAPRIVDATRNFPWRLYRWATPFDVREGRQAAAQIGAMGVSPDDVRWIVLSHFHADHLAGLRDFPLARIVAPGDGYEEVRGRRGFAALRRAFVPSLMPPDFAERTRFLGEPAGDEVPGLGPAHDLFGDGTLRLVSLPGHARGQLGMLAQAPDGPVFFVADAAWHSRAIRENRPPHPVTRPLMHSPRDATTTLERLAAFAAANPGVRLVPSHCPEAAAREGAL